jgi:hypothetical protein
MRGEEKRKAAHFEGLRTLRRVALRVTRRGHVADGSVGCHRQPRVGRVVAGAAAAGVAGGVGECGLLGNGASVRQRPLVSHGMPQRVLLVRLRVAQRALLLRLAARAAQLLRSPTRRVLKKTNKNKYKDDKHKRLALPAGRVDRGDTPRSRSISSSARSSSASTAACANSRPDTDISAFPRLATYS